MQVWSSVADQLLENLCKPGLSRRQFLGASVIGSAAIAGGSALALLTHSPSAHAASYTVLRVADVNYFSAMLPAVIVQARSAEAVNDFLDSMERMLTPASPNAIGAIQDLVDLLTGSLTRPLMTLTWNDWPEMSTDQAAEILNDWQNSSIGLKNLAYGLTTSLIRTAWYMQPEAQAISGYPGSPKKIVEVAA